MKRIALACRRRLSFPRWWADFLVSPVPLRQRPFPILLRGGIATACVLLGALAGAAPAVAATPVVYAALGDSYSSGVGAGSYYSSSGSCYRGARSYPALWAAAHSPSQFAFLACSGATTSDVIGSQVSGVPSGATLVTLTVGGNDVGFVSTVTTCKTGTTAACSSAVASAENTARNTLPAALDQTYANIRSKAPGARLVVLGYPRLFETGASCGLFGMSQANRIRLNSGADVLNAVIKDRAAAAGADFVAVAGVFAGHGICASVPWINGLVLNVSDSYHPNASGYSQAYLPSLTAVTG